MSNYSFTIQFRNVVVHLFPVEHRLIVLILVQFSTSSLNLILNTQICNYYSSLQVHCMHQ